MEKLKGAPHAENNVPLKFMIDGKMYETFDQYKTGQQLKSLAGIPLETELYLLIDEPYEDELIENDTSVNLARPEVERFVVKKKLRFYINGEEFVWYKQFIKGAEIRELGQISNELDIYLDIEDGWEDDLIRNNEEVDLARPGKECFVSRERQKELNLIVNAREKSWTMDNISFEQLIGLAFGAYDSNPSRGYTASYCDGPKENREGIMVKGSAVFVKNKMKFDVTATDKS